MSTDVRCPNGHRGDEVATVKQAALRQYHPSPYPERPTDPAAWNRLWYCYTCGITFDPKPKQVRT